MTKMAAPNTDWRGLVLIFCLIADKMTVANLVKSQMKLRVIIRLDLDLESRSPHTEEQKRLHKKEHIHTALLSIRHSPSFLPPLHYLSLTFLLSFDAQLFILRRTSIHLAVGVSTLWLVSRLN